MKLPSFFCLRVLRRRSAPPESTQPGGLDYRRLLKCYMCGVLEAEGAAFEDWASDADAAEQAELKCIRDEILVEQGL